MPGNSLNSLDQINQNGAFTLPADSSSQDFSAGAPNEAQDALQAEQDHLIAENQGNTISDDDPVTSGSQEVAARYNQLASSYGDSVSLTSASVVLSHEDQTGTIIYTNNASGSGEIKDEGKAPSDIQGNSAKADEQASAVAGASGSTADNAANAVRSAAVIIGDRPQLSASMT